MNAAVVRVEERRRIRSRAEVATLAQTQYGALLRQLEALEPNEWRAATECHPWTVHDMVAHLLGAAHATASFREAVRQLVHGQRHKDAFGGNDLDAMNALQVRDHARKSPAELIAELREVAPQAVRRRSRFPRMLAGIPVPLSTGGNAAEGMPEATTLGELQRVIYSRDVFMHRIDIARATGRDLDLDPASDRRLVEDVVIEWCERHGEPVSLHLTGPAGGTYVFRGGTGDRIEMDAVEFCRALSGRAPSDGLLRHLILF